MLFYKEKNKSKTAMCRLCKKKITDEYRIAIRTYGDWEKYLHVDCVKQVVEGM